MKKEEILDLLSKMTLEEKIGQMIQVAGDIFLLDDINVSTGPLKNLNLADETLYNIGSVLNVMGAERVKKVQDEYLSKNRLKIPLLFMDDIINGYKTVFPIPIAQGCSWSEEVVKRCTEISILEANVAGAHVNFSPMVDLSRDSRWGRVMESIGGEDPYLGQVYAETMVKAYQGKDIADLGSVASCVKHLAAYGAVEAGRDYNTVDMSEREFRQYHLPAYQTAIEAKAEMIMTSFNTLNGIPATINKWLIQDLLRKELGFEGIVISDYSAIEETIAHGVSKDAKEAAKKAVLAGVDIDMMSGVYANHLKELCLENEEIRQRVDESVLRILNLKNKLGLFENPYGNANEEKEKKYIGSKETMQEAKKLTQETFVLLKNKNNVLPINKEQKVALIGPYADNTGITGSWSMFSDRKKNETILEAFKQIGLEENILYAKGSEILRQDQMNQILEADGGNLIHIENESQKEDQLIKEAIDVAKQSDVIILALGEHYRQSGEACSRSNIDLPINQQRLINELSRLGKPIAMLLFNGRPLGLREIEDKIDSILEVWFPGTTGARAIVETLLGQANPSGKLVMSFPQNAGQCPIYYNHYSTGRPDTYTHRYLSKYQDIPTESFYPFGHGLSYCDFEYTNLKLNKNQITEDDTIMVTVDVENTSKYEGYEVIQLYIQDLFASIVRPVKELKGFQKVFFKPLEKKTIEFEIDIEMLKFWNENLEYIAEEGEFKVYVGSSSKEVLEESFTL